MTPNRRDIVRTAQMLINDCESSIAKANPARQGERTDLNLSVPDGEVFLPGRTLSEIRTAAPVWDEVKAKVEADPEAEGVTPV